MRCRHCGRRQLGDLLERLAGHLVVGAVITAVYWSTQVVYWGSPW